MVDRFLFLNSAEMVASGKPKWFTYEKSSLGKWNPVVYHMNEPEPHTSRNVNGDTVTRSEVWLVPPDCIGVDGEPMFGKLEARFLSPMEGK